MAWTLTDDLADYHRAAGHLLNADAVRNTVLLSVLASLISLGPTAFGPQPPLFGWYAEDSARRTVRAAVLQTPRTRCLSPRFRDAPPPSLPGLSSQEESPCLVSTAPRRM
jgi:phage gp46-like protein